jgi:hypothetical protein
MERSDGELEHQVNFMGMQEDYFLRLTQEIAESLDDWCEANEVFVGKMTHEQFVAGAKDAGSIIAEPVKRLMQQYCEDHAAAPSLQAGRFSRRNSASSLASTTSILQC